MLNLPATAKITAPPCCPVVAKQIKQYAQRLLFNRRGPPLCFFAAKVGPGRGKNSLAQLIVSLVITSGSRLPVGFGVLAGTTNDFTTLPDVYETVNRIADDGSNVNKAKEGGVD